MPHKESTRKESTLDYYLSLEHGSETDRVPSRWRTEPSLQPLSLYGLSSFNYSLIGVLLFALLVSRPERAVYSAEYLEAALWMWQGAISYKCDAIDLGVRSWSHPTDRISATLFTIWLSVKYTLVVRCEGSWGVVLWPALSVALLVGVYCFQRSCLACRAADREAYARWHVRWHFAFPLTMASFYLVQFYAPREAVRCAMAFGR